MLLAQTNSPDSRGLGGGIAHSTGDSTPTANVESLMRTPDSHRTFFIGSARTRFFIGLAVVLLTRTQPMNAQQSIVAGGRSVDWGTAGLPGDTPPARATLCA